MLNFRTTLTGATLAALAAGTALANPYAPYKGTTLIVDFPAQPYYDAAINVLDQFTEETGIEVGVDQLQYLRMRERQTLELAKYFMNPAPADPTYDQSDLITGYVQNIGVAGGEKGYLPGALGFA
ncbi:multiple sugar transport system substrate-binding protein [Jannaschia faecimaris]|uniref:Multiple sugar transport system substrate-binding protein n=1 Tax=Jannaschia faecimaris TaxID=1244108 RepID=A0A1H3TI09_9RHOB|nr:hypothetical protein [Jannaschia faecimaris]SDZ49913.1 multiple sugar transport system substrate-binding protein [Jannaschia faecimaris]